jgi:predicted MPP superfamily phosphohydrolase
MLGVLMAAALGLSAFWLEPASLTTQEVTLSVGWPLPRPLRIVVLTDLHVGSPYNGMDKLRSVVDRSNAANAGLVCLLGDVVMIEGVVGGRTVPPETIAPELGRLRARAGVFAVLGNHDGWFDHHRVRLALAQYGIHVVEDTAVRADTDAAALWVAGISDLWTGKHDPDVFPEVPRRVTLTLAGHTHGGQVKIPFFGPPIVPSRYGRRFAAGHVVEGGRHMFVATGVGTSILPVRFLVPPAVTVLTLQP